MSKRLHVVCLIPARMGSSRFPGKPMALLQGKPMVQHVYENAKRTKIFNCSIVATCDQVILNHMQKIGANVIMTSKKHRTASDRCAEALSKYEKMNQQQVDVVIMLQGDEPLIGENELAKCCKPFLQNKTVQVTNLIKKIVTKKELRDPNTIKTVFNKSKEALYFTRSAIPYQISKNTNYGYKQVCAIGFKRKMLFKYLNLVHTNLEKAESIDMLRLLENDIKIQLVEIKRQTYAVDTPKDLRKVSAIMKRAK